MKKLSLPISILLGVLLLFSIVLIENFTVIFAPEEALIKKSSFYSDSKIAKWQVEYLLEKGYSPGRENKEGRTAFMVAFILRDLKLIQLFSGYLSEEEKKQLLLHIKDWNGHDPELMDASLNALK